MRWKLPDFRSKKILFSWLRSFILILLIPIVLMAAVYWKTTDVIEEEINRANAALLTQLQQDIDGQIESIQRMSQEITLNARVRNLLYVNGDLDAEKRMTIYKTLDDFSVYSSTNRAIDRFYIYFDNANFILSESSYHKPEELFLLDDLATWISYEAWMGLMQESHRSHIIKMDKGNQLTPSGNSPIVFMQSLPIEDIQNAKATLVIHLNLQRLHQAMDNIQKYQGGQVYVMDANDEILFSTDSTTDLDSAIWDGMNDEYGVVHREVAGEQMTISYIQSKFTNWKYIYKLSSGKFHEKSQYIRDMTLLIICCALLSGIVLAVLLARRHYHPLKGLVQSVSSRVNIQQGTDADEYRFLEMAMDNTFEEKNELSQTIEQQYKMLRSNFLIRLVKGRMEQQEPLEELYASHDIKFKSDRFAVMLFYIEGYTGLFREGENDAEKKLKLVHLIVQNIVEEMASYQHLGYVAEADEMLFCLFNFNRVSNDSEAFSNLQKVAHDAHQFIQKRFGIEITISVSNIHRTHQGMPIAYQEALQAMEYKILNANPSVILYENIRFNEGTYTYTLEKEQQLINYIKAGAMKEAEQTVDEIMIGGEAGESPISVEMVRCLMFDITSTMMKASMEVNSGQQDMFMENQKSIQVLLQCQSIPEMRRQLSEFLEKVCTHVQGRKKSHNVELRDAVLLLIEEQFADANLSLTVLAEACSVSPSYLSRFFKEQVGVTLSDYINKYRVEKAKELLVRDEVQQRLIAEQVGFSSISTFIRTFKKLEGVTPGMYREGNK